MTGIEKEVKKEVKKVVVVYDVNDDVKKEEFLKEWKKRRYFVFETAFNADVYAVLEEVSKPLFYVWESDEWEKDNVVFLLTEFELKHIKLYDDDRILSREEVIKENLEKLYKFDFIIDSQTQLTKAINILKQEKEALKKEIENTDKTE